MHTSHQRSACLFRVGVPGAISEASQAPHTRTPHFGANLSFVPLSQALEAGQRDRRTKLFGFTGLFVPTQFLVWGHFGTRLRKLGQRQKYLSQSWVRCRGMQPPLLRLGPRSAFSGSKLVTWIAPFPPAMSRA